MRRDCGLACALMVLRAFGLHQYDMAYLMRVCATKSIWTIDLAHVLSHCGAAVTFTTVTIGANPSYAGERFYAENMAEDEARVDRLFRVNISPHKHSRPAFFIPDDLLAQCYRYCVAANWADGKLLGVGLSCPWFT
jgi:hypothetical protein